MNDVIAMGIVIVVVVLFVTMFFSRLRLRTIALLVAGVVIVYTAAVVLVLHRLDSATKRRNGPQRVFAVTGQTQFLEESIALEGARQTLLLDGFTNEVWEPAKDPRTVAPDGRADIYLARNTQNPKSGFLMFTNTQGAQLFLLVEIEGTNVVSQRVGMK